MRCVGHFFFFFVVCVKMTIFESFCTNINKTDEKIFKIISDNHFVDRRRISALCADIRKGQRCRDFR